MFVNLSVWSEVMRQYGSLLEDYDTNSALVNDCIFTMMHHVAGDLASPHTLYIPSILQSFSRIWEQGIQICEDWVDLIGRLARQIFFLRKQN
jgi:timeless protein